MQPVSVACIWRENYPSALDGEKEYLYQMLAIFVREEIITVMSYFQDAIKVLVKGRLWTSVSWHITH